MKKNRKKYRFHLVRKDNGGIIFTSKKTYRNEKLCWKIGTWFALYYCFSQNQVAIAITTE